MRLNTTETTFILFKPESIERRLIGIILNKFENAGLNIEDIKKTYVTKDLANKHYRKDQEWIYNVGTQTFELFYEKGLDPQQILGIKNPISLGKRIRQYSVESIASRSLIACILSGPEAVNRVKKIIGPTEPSKAPQGTIRGDFGEDTILSSTPHGRTIRNLIHRSSNPQEAKREIEIWFR